MPAKLPDWPAMIVSVTRLPIMATCWQITEKRRVTNEE
jgi:hypothetical protein